MQIWSIYSYHLHRSPRNPEHPMERTTFESPAIQEMTLSSRVIYPALDDCRLRAKDSGVNVLKRDCLLGHLLNGMKGICDFSRSNRFADHIQFITQRAHSRNSHLLE
jgi:hypothetical protein